MEGLLDGIVEQGSHAELKCLLPEFLCAEVRPDALLQCRSRQHEFVDARPAPISAKALAAPHGLPGGASTDAVCEAAECGQGWRIRRNLSFTGGTQRSHEPLSQRGLDCRGNEIRLHAHVEKANDGARRIVGMKRAEDQVAGE